MNNAIFTFPKPSNEPVQGYKPGSAERKAIRQAMDKLLTEVTEIPIIVCGLSSSNRNRHRNRHQTVTVIIFMVTPSWRVTMFVMFQ